MDKATALLYVKRKKRRKRAAIISAISALAMTVMIVIAFCIITADRFTITTANEPGLQLTIDENRENFTTELIAPPLLKATDTQYLDVVETLDRGLGSKNTDYYFAYSFYLNSISKEQKTINYNLAIALDKYTNGLEDAIRVMVIKDSNKPRVYAKASESGEAKPIYHGVNHDEATKEQIGETEPFRKNKYIIVETHEIEPGEFNKYSIVIWIDGWESVNSMRGGIFQADLKFSTNSIN